MPSALRRVPLLDLQAQYASIREEVLAAVTRVCDSQRFILGPEVEAFEREMAAILEVEHAIGVSSGTDALLVALMALSIGPGDEVVVPTYSFFATAGCVSRLGARPVLVDVDEVTFNIDAAGVEKVIGARTKAIMPVHLFGLAADMDAMVTIAKQANIPIIEDAAQAIGARYRGQCVGGLGAIGCFSFYPSKNLGAFGDAGLVTTNDRQLADRLRLLRNHGAGSQYRHAMIGGNFRLDALQAAVLRVKAPHLSRWTEARRRNAERYNDLFADSAIPGVRLPFNPPDAEHIFNQYVIRVPRRDRLKSYLSEAGIGTEIYYPVPFHLQECFADLGYATGSFPRAEAAAEESLALPIYGELTADQQRYVVDSIGSFYKR